MSLTKTRKAHSVKGMTIIERNVPPSSIIASLDDQGGSYLITLRKPVLYPKFPSVLVRISSVANLILWTVCTALEVYLIPASYWVGVWSSITYMLAGFIGFSASFKKTKDLMLATLTLASVAILASLAAAVVTGIDGSDLLSSDNTIFVKISGFQDVGKHIQFSLLCASLLALLTNTILLSVTVHTLFCSPQLSFKDITGSIELPHSHGSHSFSQSDSNTDDICADPCCHEISVSYFKSSTRGHRT